MTVAVAAGLVGLTPKTKSACSQRTFPPVSQRIMANRKLGCLTLFLFLALCASVIINIFLTIAVLGRVSTGVVREEPLAKFREIVVQRGGRGVSDRIAVIVMRGLISSSIPGAASDNMVDDLRMALQQARDDDRVKGVVLEVDSPGGEVTASDMIYNAVVKTRARKPVVVYMDSLVFFCRYYRSRRSTLCPPPHPG